MKLRSALLTLVASAFVLTPLAKADSVILESHSGDSYTYDLQIDNYGATFLLSGFDITGLSGVTDADLTGRLADVFDPLGGVSFTSDSVSVGTLYGFSYGFTNPYSIGTLTITSTAASGVADFSVGDSNGYFTGNVDGPVSAATPEPSSLLLLGTGILAAAGAIRRRLAV